MRAFEVAYLHRHLHDFLVGRNELISHLLEQFERKFRALGGERDGVDIAFAGGEEIHGRRLARSAASFPPG